MRIARIGFVLLLAATAWGQSGTKLGDILGRIGKGTAAPGNEKIVAGLRQALEIGAGNAISKTGRTDGFFRNAAIKILLPEKLRVVEKGLRAGGMGKLVDDFELSMNRAAEKATPEAKAIFLNALKQMTLDDGRRILTGGDTAATAYFREKTSASLAAAFRPIVVKSMEQTGVARQYKQMLAGLPALPFFRKDAFDLDEYVVSKSLGGIFYMLGEEERKIRTDPAARVTALLKEVFGR